MDNLRPVQIAAYMRHFECIGSMCEDTCCVGWTVRIDRPTFEHYRNVTHPIVKPLLDQHMTQFESIHQQERQYAYFQMTEGYRCPMLDSEQLCQIQKTLGEPALSAVCANYPRTYQQVDQQLELTASVSCPEIARLALLRPEGITFEPVEMVSEPFRQTPQSVMDPQQDRNQLKRHFQAIRRYVIACLQDRIYSLDQRMERLGAFCGQLQAWSTHSADADIGEWSYETGAEHQVVHNEGIRYRISIRSLAFLKDCLDGRLQMGAIQERFATCYTAFLYGSGLTTATEIAEVEQKLAYGAQIIEDYFQQNDYVFENDLVNMVLQHLFPFGDAENPLDAYALLAVRYGILKMVLTGMAAFHERMDDGLVLTWIQSFTKATSHQPQYPAMIRARLLAANRISVESIVELF